MPHNKTESSSTADCLIEILTEEMPPKSLKSLAIHFAEGMREGLEKASLTFSEVKYFATPRRLAVLVTQLANQAPTQSIERKGPAWDKAFDAEGNPTQATKGFAASCGVQPRDLVKIETDAGAWVGCRVEQAGKSVAEHLPVLTTAVLAHLPIRKRMRWGSGEATFVRPVHGVVMLYGEEVIPATILGCKASNKTVGHRFMSPDTFTISAPLHYEAALQKHYVIADFEKRRAHIRALAEKAAAPHAVLMRDELVDEVTGLVEWPIALKGSFEAAFLTLPEAVLISVMHDHQRYFPVTSKDKKLSPHFIVISNIESQHEAHVVKGYERVLRARLKDAVFFFEEDRKISLEKRVEDLRGIVFQEKLGSIHDKAIRLSNLIRILAGSLNVQDTKQAVRVGLLAKADLTTQMVTEFPVLQGVMGEQYALHDHEPLEIAQAIREHYLPRFAGDTLPTTTLGQIVALADRIDTLVGIFGVNQAPTGDKDPYGLRRLALGLIRILIEHQVNLAVKQMIAEAKKIYPALPNAAADTEVWTFITERLRVWYVDQGVGADTFKAVMANDIDNFCDLDRRIQAVEAFKQTSHAKALSLAHKRVSHLLEQATDQLHAGAVNPTHFEHEAEQSLFNALAEKRKQVSQLYEKREYKQILLKLADLHAPLDQFFEAVMVMTDDPAKRANRLLLLVELRTLFLGVADIALLQ
jgi:glycyl-tRNA synthetase beta chain